ncbi:MAG: hypothetical protein OQJ69_00790, partial [Flavobacteriales bacterium]|nr:hypothetical protein [Flavobacteriales bacterium]
MNRYLENFKNKLVEIDFETLEEDPHSIYAVDENFNLIYFNEAYFQFARDNDGEPQITNNHSLGSNILSAIKGDIKKIYAQALTEVLTTGKSKNLSYECSSIKKYRLFMQRLYPLKKAKGVVIINSLQVESELKNVASHLEKNYLQETGFINQCSNCRRTQSAIDINKWDWVPSYIS